MTERKSPGYIYLGVYVISGSTGTCIMLGFCITSNLIKSAIEVNNTSYERELNSISFIYYDILSKINNTHVDIY